MAFDGGIGMRMLVIILVGALAGGCAATGTAPASQPIESSDHPAAAPAAALVFSTPAGLYLPPELLRRDGRGESAYWGLQGPTTTYHYIRTDDRWGYDDFRGNFGDSYRRRAVMMQLGVSVRP